MLLALLLVSCATTDKASLVSTTERLALLEQEIQNWRTFQINGLCEIQSGVLSIRGHCVIAKNDDKARVDVVNSGVFGLGASGFTGYVDREVLRYKMPGETTITEKPHTDEMALIYELFALHLTQTLDQHKNDIVETMQCVVEGFKFTFTPSMRISEITYIDTIYETSSLKATFHYDRQDNLTEFSILTPNIRKLTVQVERVKHNDVMVREL